MLEMAVLRPLVDGYVGAGMGECMPVLYCSDLRLVLVSAGASKRGVTALGSAVVYRLSYISSRCESDSRHRREKGQDPIR